MNKQFSLESFRNPDGTLQAGPYVIDQDNRHVCVGYCNEGSFNDLTEMVNRANVAPELLEALREAKEFIDSLMDATTDEAGDFLTNNGDLVQERLDSAISKAEGK